MVFRVELQERDIFKLCKEESFLHTCPLVCLDESWCFHKAGASMDKCAARAPLCTYFTYPKSYCSSWNCITAPSQALTMAPDLPGFQCYSDSGGDAPEGKSHCQQPGTFNPFSPAATGITPPQSLPCWEFIPYPPVLSTGKKLNLNLSNFC